MVIAGQLWIFTKTTDADTLMPDFLAEMSRVGYDAIEGMFGRVPDNVEMMDSAGLRYLAPHLGTRLLEPVDDVVDFCRKAGATGVVASGPLAWNERSTEAFRATAEFLNRVGEQLKDRGLKLYYHNHEFEFEDVEPGCTAMDLLLAELDPELVSLCLDVGWQWMAGNDPVAFMAENAERIGFVHLRDFRGRESMPLGQGDLPLGALTQAVCALPNLEAITVEQDPTTETPLDDMLTSCRFLRDDLGL